MKTYPYHTPNGIIELVEKRELQNAVKRMEQVTSHDLKITFQKGGAASGLERDAIEAVRARLIQAAKGES